MAEATQQDTVIKPKKPFDPVATLVRHWFKIVVFGGVLFTLLAPLAFILSKPFYEVSGKLVVLPVTESMISRRDEGSIASYYSQFINTQLDVIKSPRILEKAIDNLPPEIKKHFMPGGISLSLAARLLKNGLDVSQPRGTQFINIKLSRDKAGGMAEIVNSIMEVYIEEYQKDEEGKDHRRLSYLQVEKENLSSEIEKQTTQLKKISEVIASSIFSGNNDEAAQFQSTYESAYRDRVEKENKLKAIIKEAEALKKLSLDAYIQEMIENNTLVSQLEILAQQSLHKLRDSKIGLSKENPGRKQLEDRIRNIQEYTSEQKDIIKENTKQLLYEKRETELQQKIIHAETELNAAKMIEEEILRKRDQLLVQRAEITTKELTRKQIDTSLEQMKNQLNKIDNRLYELKLESKAPGKIRLERMADKPGMTSGSNLKKLVILVFLFAFGSITGVCVLFDILDDRIRNERDFINCLGTPPHRPIADYLQFRLKNSPFSRVLLDDPTNKVAQSIHSLAIKLDKERKGHDAKIAVFTGVDAKSGVTEIMLNTANAMSKLCSRVLVIETNFAHPSLKELINSDEEKKGLLDLIVGQTPLSNCITHDRERGIDIILSGRIPSEDDLVNLDRSKISRLLEKAKERYDFILIDTTPMLISDMAEFIIVQSDITSLVIQRDRSLYKFTHLAGQTLFKLEVPAIAAVFNYGAPRYKTKIQETVFKLLWPAQAWIKNKLFGSLNPIPKQPYPSVEITGNAAESKKSSLTETLKKALKHRIVLNAGKSIIILYLFIQFTLFITFISSTATVDTNIKKVVRKKIIKPSKSYDINGYNIDKVEEPVKGTDKPINSVSKTELREQKSYVENTIKGESWILKQNPDLYTIQLLGSVDRQSLLRFARTHGIENKVACYHKFHKGIDWYSLIYGLYPKCAVAREELKNLPDELLKSSPWILSVADIQKSINTKNPDPLNTRRVD
jgi:succinoglycan biosynthesis transport protein ExoP